ncbi:hypothetical protein C0993_001652, partial [Termitomyces sp. T159_Od127]
RTKLTLNGHHVYFVHSRHKHISISSWIMRRAATSGMSLNLVHSMAGSRNPISCGGLPSLSVRSTGVIRRVSCIG